MLKFVGFKNVINVLNQSSTKINHLKIINIWNIKAAKAQRFIDWLLALMWTGLCHVFCWEPRNIYLLTPLSRVLFEKLTGSQLAKKFPILHGNRRFITAFTSARHLSLSWASSIQSIALVSTAWRSILILPSHLRVGLPSGLIQSRLQTKLQTSYVIRVVFLHMEVLTATEMTIPDRASWTWLGLSITWDRLYNCPADMWSGLLIADGWSPRAKKKCVSTQRSITTSQRVNGFAVQLSLHLPGRLWNFQGNKRLCLPL